MTQQLPVHGQGIFVFRQINANQPCSFRFTTPDGDNGLQIEFTSNAVTVHEIASLKPLPDTNNKSGIVSNAGAYYWFSLDSQNQRLYAGVGECRLETVIYTYAYEPSHATKRFLESLTQVQGATNVQTLRIVKDPLTSSIALRVKDTADLTMDNIASAAYMPKANLTPVAQKLYDCIAGPKFTLNTPDFPDFAAAIEHSINTPGLWCYNKLRDKSREFNPDKPNLAETYLRITLGQNNGESPGVPYVMEIWPAGGHYSPIHSHSAANAVIRVLHGSINVSLFPYLCNQAGGVAPFGVADFKEGDITWISPTLNQVHQLRNNDPNTICITIQCYMYNDADNRHYDYFDYLDDNGQTQLYEPDSDMDFVAFKQLMRKEWSARSAPVVSSKGCLCWK